MNPNQSRQAAELPIDNAYSYAARRAKYGRRDWLVWSRDGFEQAAPMTKDSVKCALLAIGTQGWFTVIHAGNTCRSKYTWRMGITALRSCALNPV